MFRFLDTKEQEEQILEAKILDALDFPDPEVPTLDPDEPPTDVELQALVNLAWSNKRHT